MEYRLHQQNPIPVTVVDAEQFLGLPQAEMQLARAQVAGGDLILLNKIDLVDAATLARVHKWIDSIRPGVQVFQTSQCQLPMEILLGKSATDPKSAEPDGELGIHTHEVTNSGKPEHDHHGYHPEHDLMFDT